MTDLLLELLPTIGLPVLFAVTFVSCFGLPVPGSLMLLVSGSFAAAGDLEVIPVVLVALSGAVLGDQAGFQIGKHGGGLIEGRISTSAAHRARIAQAKAFTCKWGTPGVFFSRWLVSPLGPYVNLAGGMLGFSWPRFTLSGVIGEIFWVGIYVGLGYTLSGSVLQFAEMAGEFSLLLAAGAATLVLGWRLHLAMRKNAST